MLSAYLDFRLDVELTMHMHKYEIAKRSDVTMAASFLAYAANFYSSCILTPVANK